MSQGQNQGYWLGVYSKVTAVNQEGDNGYWTRLVALEWGGDKGEE